VRHDALVWLAFGVVSGVMRPIAGVRAARPCRRAPAGRRGGL